jgi:hypothetical protein
MSFDFGKEIFSRMLKHANHMQQCISGPRRSLADYVLSACGSRSSAGDTPEDGRAGVDTSDHGGAGVDTSYHRGAGVDNSDHRGAGVDTSDHRGAGVDTSYHRGAGIDTLNHPDPLRACRLPCAHRDSPGKENCARRRRNGYGVTECVTISLL